MSELDSDACDVQVTASAADLQTYVKAMQQPNGWQACLVIEEAWALDGYPPAVVTEVLHAVANGEPFSEALDAALS